MYLRIFCDERLAALRNGLFKTKEEFYFALEIVIQTFIPFTHKNFVMSEFHQPFVEIKHDFIAYLKNLFSGEFMPKELGTVKHEVYIQVTAMVFQLFDTNDCLSMFQVDWL